MPSAKKTVGHTAICSDKELRRVDPVWLQDRVSHGYWEDAGHRREYLLWLAGKLRFRSLEDLYKLTQKHVLDNRGQAMLCHWGYSVVNGVKECFPDYDWQEWLFGSVPPGFWQEKTNRHRYLRWLGDELGYRKPDDWYAIREKDFADNHGRGCLQYYRWSAKSAAMDLFPKHQWCEWKFATVPVGFWHRRENRERFVKWLGEKLGYRKAEDWYRVRMSDFTSNGGGGLLGLVSSHIDVLRECLPELDWTPRPGVRKRAAAVRPLQLLPTEPPKGRRGNPRPGGWNSKRGLVRPRLTIKQILAWADTYHERTGNWPVRGAVLVPGELGETWGAINTALADGHRGLPGGTTLASLLAKHRGVQLRSKRPPLKIQQVLKWADEHRKRTGKWPIALSGMVHGVEGESWAGIQQALYIGGRGMPGGSSLIRLLAEHRGARNRGDLPALSIEQILKWAKQHHKRTGEWPDVHSGPIPGAKGEQWSTVHGALMRGTRDLPGGISLARLLCNKLGVGNRRGISKLTVEQILKWADRHHRSTGEWPQGKSGPVIGAKDENWRNLDAALRMGGRGLPGDSSLAQVLHEHRSVRNRAQAPKLSTEKILTWARHHHRVTGEWPTGKSGPVLKDPDENWLAINAALNIGCRGLRKGSSLAKLLKKHGLKKR